MRTTDAHTGEEEQTWVCMILGTSREEWPTVATRKASLAHLPTLNTTNSSRVGE
jgi:hypothetical protein